MSVGGRSGKLTAGGILCILAGAIGLLVAILALATNGGSETTSAWGTLTTALTVLAFIASAIAILGGYYALRRKHFWWAIAGAVCALLFSPTFGYGGLPLGAVLPIAALILIWLSRKEFA